MAEGLEDGDRKLGELLNEGADLNSITSYCLRLFNYMVTKYPDRHLAFAYRWQHSKPGSEYFVTNSDGVMTAALTSEDAETLVLHGRVLRTVERGLVFLHERVNDKQSVYNLAYFRALAQQDYFGALHMLEDGKKRFSFDDSDPNDKRFLGLYQDITESIDEAVKKNTGPAE